MIAPASVNDISVSQQAWVMTDNRTFLGDKTDMKKNLNSEMKTRVKALKGMADVNK